MLQKYYNNMFFVLQKDKTIDTTGKKLDTIDK